MELLHIYAELTAADASAAQRYPGMAAHLAACGPCGEDFDGLLTASAAQDEQGSHTRPVVIAAESRTGAPGPGLLPGLRLRLGLEVSLPLGHISALPTGPVRGVQRPASKDNEHHSSQAEDHPHHGGHVASSSLIQALGH